MFGLDLFVFYLTTTLLPDDPALTVPALAPVALSPLIHSFSDSLPLGPAGPRSWWSIWSYRLVVLLVLTLGGSLAPSLWWYG